MLNSYKYPLLLCFVGVVLIFSGAFSSNLFGGTKIEAKKELPKESIVKNDAGLIKADISGAVNKPGVYSIPKDSRVEDLIKQAEGLKDDANAEFISKTLNLSQKLSDGTKVYIPFKDEKTPAAVMGISSAATGGITGSAALLGQKISINNASQNQLEELPGVGPSTANKIIAGRPYAEINDLLSKKVVGKAVFEKIKELVDL